MNSAAIYLYLAGHRLTPAQLYAADMELLAVYAGLILLIALGIGAMWLTERRRRKR